MVVGLTLVSWTVCRCCVIGARLISGVVLNEGADGLAIVTVAVGLRAHAVGLPMSVGGSLAFGTVCRYCLIGVRYLTGVVDVAGSSL